MRFALRAALSWLAAAVISTLVSCPAWGQAQRWQAGVAKVSVDPKLKRKPGTAIVVALKGQTAYLVTCAHVVENDPNPRVEFVAFPDQPFTATRKDFQDEAGKRGLALLVVNGVPRQVRALVVAARAEPVMAESVIVAGFPAAASSDFTTVDVTISKVKGVDITLSRETREGFSGGPVLRGDTAIGLVYGDGSGYGLAFLSDVVRL